MSPADPRHGTKAGYHAHRNAGQPACGPCTDAAARYERARQLDLLNGRDRLVPSIGTQRRLRALVALGHTWKTLGDQLGMERTNVRRLAVREPGIMRASLADAIATLYDAWSMRVPTTTDGPGARRIREARQLAADNGWLPPLAWEGIDIDDPNAVADPGGVDDDVDPVVIQRILAGDPTPARAATPAERHLVVTTWETTGRPLRDLIDLTGWKPERYRTTPDQHDQEDAA